MDDTSPIKWIVARVRGVASTIPYRLRRLAGIIFQVSQLDELNRLAKETRRLGSASSESIYHVGGELRSLNARLEAVEEDLAAVRRLLEEQAAQGSHERPGVGARSPE